MQQIYYFEHGQFIAPTHHMITIYNKLYSEYDIDFDDFKKLPFDIILTILSFIKFPEIIFYSKKLIETAHYSDLYEKMLLYDVMSASTMDSSNSQQNDLLLNINNNLNNNLKNNFSNNNNLNTGGSNGITIENNGSICCSAVTGGQYITAEKSRKSTHHKRTNSNSLTKTIPFTIINLISKLFGVFNKERNQRVFLFDFYSHFKFIGFDQMLNLYNSFYSNYSNSNSTTTNSTSVSGQCVVGSSSSSSRFDSNDDSDDKNNTLLLSPRSSIIRRSNDDDFLNLLTMSSPHSFEKFLTIRNETVHSQSTSNNNLEFVAEKKKKINPISIHSNLPRHLRNCVHSINNYSVSTNRLLSSNSQCTSSPDHQTTTPNNNNNNTTTTTTTNRRRSKSLGSSQIAIQVQRKIMNEDQSEQNATVVDHQVITESSTRKRFSIQFYNVRNFFYIPYLEAVTFSNCSNQANYYINFVVIPFFRFNNHLKSFKLIDCQLSQESVRELYFQLRAMFIQMHKSGQSSYPCYPSLREFSLADNELLLHCSWNFIFPNIRNLDLSGNRSLIEPSLCKLLSKDIENFKFLKRLNLSNGCFDGNMIVKNNTLEELDVFDTRVPLNTTQLDNQIIKYCKRIKLIKYYSAQEKKLVKWVNPNNNRGDDS